MFGITLGVSIRTLIPLVIFVPPFLYLAFSWTDCIDGACDSGSDTSFYLIVAMVTFPLLLLLLGIGSALRGTGSLRNAPQSKNYLEAFGAGLDLSLAFKLVLIAIAGFASMYAIA